MSARAPSNKYPYMSPKGILFNSRFALFQGKYWLILLMYVVSLGLLSNFGVLRVDGVLAFFSVPIVIITFLALGLGLLMLAEVEMETRIAQLIDKRSSRMLAEIQEGQRARLYLEQVSEVLPQNRSSSIVHICSRILKKASDRQFELAEAIMRPYREDSADKILRLNSVQRFVLQLGMLGTLIGIVLAIAALSSLGGMDVELLDRTQFLASLVSSLQISFGAAIVGLQSSLIMTCLLLMLRSKQSDHFMHIEDSVVSFTSLTLNAINEDMFLADFKQVSARLRQLSERISDQNKLLDALQEINSTSENLQQLNDELDERIKQLESQVSAS